MDLYDNNQAHIGGRYYDSPTGVYEGTDSQLPYVFETECGPVDSSPVTFKYASQSWGSGDTSYCKVGAYSGGSRQMDCGFNC